jgi:hypothetical protein
VGKDGNQYSVWKSMNTLECNSTVKAAEALINEINQKNRLLWPVYHMGIRESNLKALNRKDT